MAAASAGGAVLRQPELQRDHRPTGAAAGLGSLSAGLTHELNNPAAAAVRATAVAAGPGRRHAAQAGPDRVREISVHGARTADRAAGGGGRAGREGAHADARWRPSIARTSSASGWRTTAFATVGISRRRSCRPGSTSHGSIRSPRRYRTTPSRAPSLAELHGRGRAADERDPRLDHPDLHPGRRGQAVLAAGPGTVLSRRTFTNCSTAR